jgi:hypothetical protein
MNNDSRTANSFLIIDIMTQFIMIQRIIECFVKRKRTDGVFQEMFWWFELFQIHL